MKTVKVKNRISILKLVFSTLFIFISFLCYSQKSSKISSKNSVYLEFFGLGGYGSINYERKILKHKKINLAVRGGISFYGMRDFTNTVNPDLIFPFSFNSTYGNTHKLELSAGKTISNFVHPDITTWKPKRVTDLHSHFNIGYRYQKDKGGFIFRIGYTPIVEFNRTLRHWGGASVGYAF